MKLLCLLFLLLPLMEAQGLRLGWGSYLGSGLTSSPVRHARDRAGNVYLAVRAEGNFYRSTLAPYRLLNLYVAKYDPAGRLVWGTYYGGTSSTVLEALEVDAEGNSYIAGSASASGADGFPTAGGFLLSFDTNGNRRWVRTGRWMPAGGETIGLGANGVVAVCGISGSNASAVPSEIPTIQATPGMGTFDGALAVFDRNGQPLFATFYGGGGQDWIRGCAVDETGIVHTAVVTTAPTPYESGLIGWDFAQRRRAYYSPFDFRGSVNGTTLSGSTVFLSSDFGLPSALVLSQGKLWMVGAASGELPVTADAVIRTPFSTQLRDQNVYFARASLRGEMEYVTFMGGLGTMSGMAVSREGVLYACGVAHTARWPVSTDALDRALIGERRATVSVLNPRGEIVHSTYLTSSMGTSACESISWHEGEVVVSGHADRMLPVITQPVVPLEGPNRANKWLVQLRTGPGNEPRFTSAGVTNAASFVGGTVAPGQIITLFAENVGPTSLAGLALTAERRVSTRIGDTRLLVDGTPAPLIYSVRGQVSAVVPYNVAGKRQVEMILEYNGLASAPVTVAVSEAAPGLFAVSGGAGQVVALQEAGCCNRPETPARRGEVVVLYATGEGQTTPAGRDGSLAEYATLAEYPKPVLPVSVTIGGVAAEILYAGAAPGFVAGLMQINLRVPVGAPVGDAVPVVLRVGTVASRAGVTMAVR